MKKLPANYLTCNQFNIRCVVNSNAQFRTISTKLENDFSAKVVEGKLTWKGSGARVPGRGEPGDGTDGTDGSVFWKDCSGVGAGADWKDCRDDGAPGWYGADDSADPMMDEGGLMPLKNPKT